MDKSPFRLSETFRSLFIVFTFLLLLEIVCENALGQEVVKYLNQKPVELHADHLEFFQDTGTYVAEGSIKVVQGQTVITGDHLNLNQTTGQMEISGHVLFQEGSNQLRAEKIQLNIRDQTGIVYQGHFIFGPDHYHLEGETIEKKGRNEYSANKAILTTCECNLYGDKPLPLPWRLRSSDLHLDLDHSVTGKNVFFEVRNIPVLYTPYLYVPIVQNRQTGFLIPSLGYSNDEGIKILQPFYWAIARNQDLTFSMDYRSLRGNGAEIEYRYIPSSRSNGILFTHLFRDYISGRERADVRYNHLQTLSNHIDARVSFNYVSDQDFFRDLSVSTIERSQRSMESNFFVYGRWENQSVYLLTRFTRDLTTDRDTTLQKLPELGYTFHMTPFFDYPLYLDFNTTATYFYRQIGLKAGRSDTYLRLMNELPLPHLGILTPRAGIRKTVYSRSISQDQPYERNITDLGVGFDSSLSRVYPGAESVTHIIESSLIYEYVAPVDQTDIPQFDNLDLIPDKNLFTYSLTNRLVRQEEFFYLKLTDSYLVKPTEGKFSDIRSEMMIHSGEFKIKTDGYFNFYNGSTDIFNTDLILDTPGKGYFSVGERFSRDGILPQKGDIFNPLSLGFQQNQPVPIRFLTSMLRLYLFDPLTFASKIYYDYQNNILTESDYGIRYLSKCWGITVEFIRFPDKSQVLFLINLTGFGAQGTDAFKSLFGN